MGLPSIVVKFKTQASSLIRRSQRGTVAIILKDTTATGGHVIYRKEDIPTGIGAANKKYIERSMIGNIDEPTKLIVYILSTDAENYTDALHYLETAKFDYLVGDPEITEALCSDVVDWIKDERDKGHNVKAVLPNTAADCEAVVNFTADEIKVGMDTYTTAQYCSRIAGLIVGTPLTQSITYVVLPEITEVKGFTKTELDTKIDNGELVLFSDGEKVKIGRGVTSLKTIQANQTEALKKIKAVETMDMIQSDIISTCEESYIGKLANSYDNKCIIISAIDGYLTALETEGILEARQSFVGIDLEEQRAYLLTKGVDVNVMSERELKEYNNDDKVFLEASIRLLDAIEDIRLNIII